MEITYVDESGNTGYGARASKTYSLGCVLVPADAWPEAFDRLLNFRRFLRGEFNIRVRDELKANYLVRNEGPALEELNLGDGIRRRIYRLHMHIVPKAGISAFAVVIVKGLIQQRDRDPRDIAWDYLFNRLERRSSKLSQPIMLVHDEGENAVIRKLARRARRAGIARSRFGTGTLQRPARLLIDDPVPRNSDQSYFVQLADLCAYAAFRHVIPPPKRVASVCPAGTWEELGTARIQEVSELVGGPSGIVRWPRA